MEVRAYCHNPALFTPETQAVRTQQRRSESNGAIKDLGILPGIWILITQFPSP